LGQTETVDQPVLNLVGLKVGLGPLSEAHYPLIERWRNDFSMIIISGDSVGPDSSIAVENSWAPLIRGDRPGWYGFAIYELSSLRPIGYTNVRDVDGAHRTAEFGILIGDGEHRGKGYGTEATQLMLDFAFTALNVHNVWLDTISLNVGAIKAYLKAGFKEIGRRREAFRIGDRAFDVVWMDCLATEFARPPGRWGLSELAAMADPVPD
jgi:diamine N-acetyltransferase